MVKTMNETEALYNVACFDCGDVFQPRIKSPLWWRCKQREDKGFLDAVHVYGEECGCRPKEVVRNPNAPFRVFGYDMLGENFDMSFNRMTDAMKAFIKLKQGPDIVFITGVSKVVQDRLFCIAGW